MRYIILALFFVLTAFGQLDAQKFGFINSQQLLASIPEIKTAEQQLLDFQKGLEAEGQAMVDAFEKNYLAYMSEMNEGLLSKVEMQEREQGLANEQQKIQGFQQVAEQRILEKRQEIIEPILMKVDEAIQEYGKENGFTFIFDSSAPGALLHAPDADDVTDELTAKLNQ